MSQPDLAAEISASINRSIRDHSPKLDSILFNGGTLLALGATITATVVPWTTTTSWVPRALAGLATFLIGAERALNFGGRWRYHLKLAGSYQSVLERATVAQSLPEPERHDALTKIVADLDRIRRAEGDIPIGDTPLGN